MHVAYASASSDLRSNYTFCLDGSRFSLRHRVLQTPEGRYYIDSSDEHHEIPFTVQDNLQVRLSELPNLYAERRVSDVSPSNSVLPGFIPQLHPHQLLAGEEALFQVQLTQVQAGSVLGFSFFHGLTGQPFSSCHLQHSPSQLIVQQIFYAVHIDLVQHDLACQTVLCLYVLRPHS